MAARSPPAVWALLGLYALVPPHAENRIARRSQAQRRTEQRIETFDAFVGGLWIAATGFGPWPATVFFAGYTMTGLCMGGVWFYLQTIGAFVVGGLLDGILTGFLWPPETSATTTLIGSATIVYLMAAFGFQSYAQGRRLTAR